MMHYIGYVRLDEILECEFRPNNPKIYTIAIPIGGARFTH